MIDPVDFLTPEMLSKIQPAAGPRDDECTQIFHTLVSAGDHRFIVKDCVIE